MASTEQARAKYARYNATAKGKARSARYRASEQGRAAQERYRATHVFERTLYMAEWNARRAVRIAEERLTNGSASCASTRSPSRAMTGGAKGAVLGEREMFSKRRSLGPF